MTASLLSLSSEGWGVLGDVASYNFLLVENRGALMLLSYTRVY